MEHLIWMDYSFGMNNIRFLYVYYYKNEIIILDSMMNEKNVMKSIDSLNEPELDVAFYKKTKTID